MQDVIVTYDLNEVISPKLLAYATRPSVKRLLPFILSSIDSKSDYYVREELEDILNNHDNCGFNKSDVIIICELFKEIKDNSYLKHHIHKSLMKMDTTFQAFVNDGRLYIEQVKYDDNNIRLQ